MYITIYDDVSHSLLSVCYWRGSKNNLWTNSCPKCDVNATAMSLYLEDMSEHVHIRLCSSPVLLAKPIKIHDKKSLLIDSHSSRSIMLCHDEEKYLIEFRNVSNVALQNVAVEGCGAAHESASIKGISQSSIYIFNCFNIHVIGVHILRSNGTGMVVIDSMQWTCPH